MRRSGTYRLASALLLLASAPAPAFAAETETGYPQSADQQVLIAWLGAHTNIAPAAVVSVTPELVVALISGTPSPAPAGPLRLTLREEVIAPAYVEQVGGRSSLMSLEIQCEERRVRMDERRLYSGPNLTGSAQVSEPSSNWVRIPEDSIMDDVARAACDPGYSWPFQTAQVKSQVKPDTVVALSAPAPVTPPVAEAAPEAELQEAAPPAVIAAEAPAIAAPEVISTPEPVSGLADDEPKAPPPAEEQTIVVAETPVATPPEATSAPEPAPSLALEVEPEGAPPPQDPAVIVAKAPVVAPPEVVSAPEPAPALAPEAEPEAAPPPQDQTVTVAEAPAPTQPEVALEPDAATPVPADSIPAPEPAAPALPETPRAAPPSGGPVFAVQIGAYQTPERAREAWEALSASRPVLVEGLWFDIRPVKVKGRDLLRGLVRGFTTPEEGAAFCTALAGTGYGCIPRILSE